jgi:Dyp-type peroxidase family
VSPQRSTRSCALPTHPVTTCEAAKEHKNDRGYHNEQTPHPPSISIYDYEAPRVIGRDKLTDAPLGSQSEYDPVNLQATGSGGELLIPRQRAHPTGEPRENDGQRILRRGYSYSESVEPGSGEIDAGLFFIAFQRSPARQFIPIQRRLAASDALNRHTLHTSSAIFACPRE